MPEFILAVIRVPPIIRPLKSADDCSGEILFNRFQEAGTNGGPDLSLSWQAFKDPLKYHATYGQGPGIPSKTRRVSLLVDKAQLAG